MSVKDQDGNFTFYVDENNGIVYELVMVGGTDKEFMVFSLIGEMDLRQIGKMSQKIQMNGFDQMTKIFDHGAADLNVYPNPAGSGTDFNVEVPSEMK